MWPRLSSHERLCGERPAVHGAIGQREPKDTFVGCSAGPSIRGWPDHGTASILVLVTFQRTKMRTPYQLAFVLPLLAILQPGCANRIQSLKAVSAGQIGCSPEEIQITDSKPGDGAWVATCRDVRYVCSAYQSGWGAGPRTYSVNVTANCTPEASQAVETSEYAKYTGAPSTTPRTPTSAAPTGAGGLSFGDTEAVASKACTDAGYRWLHAEGKQTAQCTGTPTSVGFEASVMVEFCASKVCIVALRRSLADVTTDKEWLARYNATTDLLRSKYGAFTSRQHDISDSCRNDLRRCVSAGEVQLQTRWQWPDGPSIRVVLGPSDGTPYVLLIYRDPSEHAETPGL